MASVICRLFGMLILIGVIAVLLPVTLPRLMGLQTYHVMSGSMEPAIPTGSLVYVRSADPMKLEKEDIIAFYQGDEVIMHRVVKNNKFDELLKTKGDANPTEDFSEVPYEQVIGKVIRHIPVLGQVMSVYTSLTGKILILCLLICGVLFNVLAGRLK